MNYGQILIRNSGGQKTRESFLKELKKKTTVNLCIFQT